MDNLTLAYLAGAMDADGYFTIKKDSRGIRIYNDRWNVCYSADAGLKQVTPIVPALLKETFTGLLRVDKPSTPNSKPIHAFRISDKKCALMCRALLPYLKIKKRHAEICIELDNTMHPRYRQVAYWFERENPNWRDMQLVTVTEAAELLGYQSDQAVCQAIHDKGILALPYSHNSHMKMPRIPLPLIEQLIANRSDRRAQRRPSQLIAWRERLWIEIHELNKIGVTGTSCYFQTGVHKPIFSQ